MADEVLENLLQVSPSRFEVIVLDVLHRLGYGSTVMICSVLAVLEMVASMV